MQGEVTMSIKFFISREGDTEQWYFEWLQKAINNDPRTKNKVEFKFLNVTPSSFTKSNHTTFTRDMLKGSYFCRIQDIEDYGNDRINKFKELLKSNKEAKKLFPKYNFYIGYSNYTFEVWMISHKAQVKTEIDRKNYYKQINKVYKKSFLDNDDYKHENNFGTILRDLKLDDVINKAIPECKRIRNYNIENNSKFKKSDYNFDYFLCNPDTSLHEFVEHILKSAGVI